MLDEAIVSLVRSHEVYPVLALIVELGMIKRAIESE